MPDGWIDKVKKRFGDGGVTLGSDPAYGGDEGLSTMLTNAPKLLQQRRDANMSSSPAGTTTGEILKKTKKVKMAGDKLKAD